MTETAILPRKAYAGDAGYDLFSDEEKTLAARERGLIRTGFRIEMESTIEAQVRPRSGLAINYGVTVLNSPGTIDASFNGEVCVILINLGENTFYVRRGDRIAQLVFSRLVEQETTQLPREDQPRDKQGFGSSGS